MKNQVCILGLVVGLLWSLPGFGQSGGGMGGMGGMGRGGMGRGGGQFQQPNSPPPSAFNGMPSVLADRETRWLKDSLNLTKDQTKAVRKLNNDFAKQQEDIKPTVGPGGTQPSPETIRQVQEIMLMTNEEKEEQLRPILTPEQWTKYKASKDLMIQQTGGFKPLPIGGKKN